MNVKGMIKQKGYTIDKVASMIGVTRVTLSQTLSRNPTVATLQKIADAIGCRVGDFFIDEMDTDKRLNLVCPKCGAKLKLIEEKD